MDAPLKQIREIYANSTDHERHKIQSQLRDLEHDMYTDWEVLFGLAMGPLKWTLIQIGLDLNIFTTLSTSSTPISHADFVAKTGASPGLLKHLLRSMASFGFIQEVEQDIFQANSVTKTFANPHVIGAAPHVSKVHFPVAQVLPEYLKEHGYKDMTNKMDLPFQNALHTDLEPFDFLKKDPEQMKALGHVMVLDAVQSWVSSYPVAKELGDFKPEANSAVLVDIGGGFGQHAVAFKQKYADLPGRVVVQDLPSTLAHLPPMKPEGIEFVEYDFFTPQTILGAKFYYLRHILHDWPDEDCVRILKSIIPVMGPESLILIDDVVLPDTNVPWQVSSMVISMMACLGGTERSMAEWEVLLDRAGLKLAHVHRYDEVKFHGIVAAVPK
ncbi:S-adenosyl-L-methionine-dependent methyltransferase [Paraphoma chrysanthemicola]|uniref:S-adenosyl-L-methionine-dependent methyltransferase n=1 Tax=Paraphoma chrysanthemicola TaxID=798071 RepID=A0A8K0R6Q3_9PLEO|nr:S-adenosyl-L-methionine-dependent methyltransferase [Paraphoma chrysanthemicola]